LNVYNIYMEGEEMRAERPRFSVGERVEILEWDMLTEIGENGEPLGYFPFKAGRHGTVKKIDPHGTVLVMLDLSSSHRAARVRIKLTNLRRVDGPRS
jgi:hypothetical protein